MADSNSLSSAEMARYNRHLKLPGFGVTGQAKLREARVLLIGAGGLGCPIGLYLAAAGVGTLGVIDDDVVEISNLQRQIAHGTAGEGQPKVESLIARMNDLNPHVTYRAYQRRLDDSWIEDVIADYDLVIDGTDNYTTRYLVADACWFAKKPLIYGAIYQFDAQLSVFAHDGGPCYRCLFPEPPAPGETPNCSDAGVLGVLPGTVGVMMATEAIKYLIGLGQSLNGALMVYNALDQTTRHLRLNRDPACPLCGERPSILKAESRKPAPDALPDVPEIEPSRAAKLLETGTAMMLDVRTDLEWDTVHLPGSLHVPLDQLNPALATRALGDNTILVICHKGIRSRVAAALLLDGAQNEVYSVTGGIDAWAREVDPNLVRY